MAIVQGLTNSFKSDILQAGQNIITETLYIALYTANADIGPDTTVYVTAGEVVGTGYTAAGNVLTGASIATLNNIVYVNFNSPQWTSATFTVRGALIYNSSQSNKSVAVLNFGSDKTVSNQTFTITMPTNSSTSALIRLPQG
jgi:hypothetical protein